jgi:hemerythrin-like metal-binding protein
MGSTATDFTNRHEELSLGIESVDREHRELALAIQELEDAVVDGDHRSLSAPLLRHVADVARAHFSSEEAFMTAKGYPGLAIHLFKHQYLMEQLESMLAHFDRDAVQLSERSVQALRSWLVTHVEGEDLQFARWLQENKGR